MSRLLYIKASPRGDRSYSNRVADAFVESYSNTSPDDEVITLDLADDVIPDFDAVAVSGKYRIMHGEKHSDEEAAAWKSVEKAVEQFKSADKYLISSPMWNFGIPYRLKQYIDVIVQPGLTFSFSPDEGYSGLVTGRPAVVVLARGGEYPAGTEGAAYDFQSPYLRTVLGFMGFEDVSEIIVEPTLQGGPETADAKLAEAIHSAKEKAADF